MNKPQTFIELLKQAIAGDSEALIFAFIWADTAPGQHYWYRQYRDHITIRAKQRLRYILWRKQRQAKALAMVQLCLDNPRAGMTLQ